MNEQPLNPVGDGDRAGNGRFRPGNKAAKGNPFARRVARLRTLILDAVTDDDLTAVVGKLVEQAKAGDLAAIRELLTRLVGKPPEPSDADRLDADAVAIHAEKLEAERRRYQATPSKTDLALRELGV